MTKPTEDREVLEWLIHRLMVLQEVNTAGDVADAIIAAGFRRPGPVTDAGGARPTTLHLSSTPLVEGI